MANNFSGYPPRGQALRSGVANRGFQGGMQPRRELPKPVAAEPLPANYVDEAERVIGEGNWARRITTSKIRRLFSLMTGIYNAELRRTADTLTPESVAQLRLAQIRMLYEAGRDEKGTKEFLKSAKLIEYLKDNGLLRLEV